MRRGRAQNVPSDLAEPVAISRAVAKPAWRATSRKMEGKAGVVEGKAGVVSIFFNISGFLQLGACLFR
jgi:hypothetical protein